MCIKWLKTAYLSDKTNVFVDTISLGVIDLIDSSHDIFKL